jgi:hypothetical protein
LMGVVDGIPAVAIVEVLPPDAPEQDVGEPATPLESEAACEVDPDAGGTKPRPTVPRPVAPRPLVPRPTATADAASKVLEELDGDEGEDPTEEFVPAVDVVTEVGELVVPDVLTKLHAVDVLVPTP